MNIADSPVCIDHTIQGHAPQLKKIHFLTIQPCNFMARIGQANIGDILIYPIFFIGIQVVRANCNDLYSSGREIGVTIAHTRQLRAAVWSHESAQECEHDGFIAAKIR